MLISFFLTGMETLNLGSEKEITPTSSQLFDNYRLLRDVLSAETAAPFLRVFRADEDDSLEENLIILSEARKKIESAEYEAAAVLLETMKHPLPAYLEDIKNENMMQVLRSRENYSKFLEDFSNPFRSRELELFRVLSLFQTGQKGRSMDSFRTLFMGLNLSECLDVFPSSDLEHLLLRLDASFWMKKFSRLLQAGSIGELQREMRHASRYPHLVKLFHAEIQYRRRRYSQAKNTALQLRNSSYQIQAGAIAFKVDYRQNRIGDVISESRRFQESPQTYKLLSWDLANMNLSELRAPVALHFFNEYIRLSNTSDEDHWKAIWLSAWLYFRTGRRNEARERFALGRDSIFSRYSTACQYWHQKLSDESQTPDISISPVSYYAMKVHGTGIFSSESLRIFVEKLNREPSDRFYSNLEILSRFWARGEYDELDRFCTWFYSKNQWGSIDYDLMGIIQSLLLHNQGEFFRSYIMYKRHFSGAESTLLPPVFIRILFPLDYLKQIRESCREYSLDPFLVLAIIRQESFFEADAVSSANAMGLMQLIYTTARLVSRQKGMKISRKELFSPEVNIPLGVHYLKSLLDKYNGKIYLALASYNAGDFRVDRWLEEYGEIKEEEFIEMIPFSQTRNYVKKILLDYFIYRHYYGGDNPTPFAGDADAL